MKKTENREHPTSNIQPRMIALVMLLGALVLSRPAQAQTAGLPGVQTGTNGVSLPGLPPIAIDTNGLSFTNVSIQLSSGYEYQGNVGGASAGYIAGQDDLWSLKNFDVGVGASAVFANTQDALDKLDAEVDIIKNLDNFQLSLPIIPIGRQFSGTPGYYFGTGLTINYNLTRGLGILGTKNGFTYLTAGYRFEKNFTTVKNSSFSHLVRLGVGYAF